MIKLFYVFVILLFGGCEKNVEPSPMLWEISGQKLKTSSYIFGTYHTKDPKINNLPQSVLTSLQNAQRLYTEIPMTKKSTQEVLSFSRLRTPIDLSKRLQPKTIKLLIKYLKQHKYPYTLNTLQPFKTWAIGLMLINQEENTKHPHSLFMDEKLVALAKSNNIKQIPLETPMEQLKYFDTLSPSNQEQFLLDVIVQQDNQEYTNALKKWYQKGDPDGFFALQERYASQDPKQNKLDKLLMEGLLLERNIRFTKRIKTFLGNTPELKHFFAIGAGHLSGDKGIIYLLKEQGYKLHKIR